jgi:hypothetical protein
VLTLAATSDSLPPLSIGRAVSGLSDLPSRRLSLMRVCAEATVNQYIATYNADLAGYRPSVLTAFQRVKDYLAAVRILSRQIQLEQKAVASAQRSSISSYDATRPASILTWMWSSRRPHC